MGERDSDTRRVPAAPKPAAPGSKRKPSNRTDAGLKTESAFDDDGEARGVRPVGGGGMGFIVYELRILEQIDLTVFQAKG